MAPLKKPTLEELYRDIDKVWGCPKCGTLLAVTSVGLTCLRCGEMQKRLLSVEEAGVIIEMIVKTTLESIPKRVRQDEKGRVLEEFFDVLDLVRAWKALKTLKV